MSIFIRTSGFPITEPLQAYTEQRIGSVADDYHPHVKNLWVRLIDINGPKGGYDKRCRVHITLSKLRDVIVEDTQPDMYDAINQAARKATQTLNRRFTRLRRRTHQADQIPAAADEEGEGYRDEDESWERQAV